MISTHSDLLPPSFSARLRSLVGQALARVPLWSEKLTGRQIFALAMKYHFHTVQGCPIKVQNQSMTRMGFDSLDLKPLNQKLCTQELLKIRGTEQGSQGSCPWNQCEFVNSRHAGITAVSLLLLPQCLGKPKPRGGEECSRAGW